MSRLRARLHTAVDIDAAEARVWSALTNFPHYPQWNPFIRSLSGVIAVGAPLEIDLQPPGGRALHLRATVLDSRPHRALRWRWALPLPGLLALEHAFGVEALEARRTRLTHRLAARGVLVPLLRGRTAARWRAGCEAMNQALKTRAQSWPPSA